MFDERQCFISTWQGPLVAVAAVRATAADRAAAVAPERARWLVGELNGDASWDVLSTLYQLAGGAAPAVDLSAGFLANAVEAAVADGRLLFVREGQGDDASGKTVPAIDGRETPDDKVAREAMANRVDIAFEGQRFRVMPFARFRTAQLSHFRVVPFEEATRLLGRLRERTGHPREQAIWTDVAARLSVQGRAGGLVLLQDRPLGQWEKRTSDEPAATPSKFKAQIAPTDWIEVDISYDDGTPFDGACSIVLPDGRKIDGAPDADGVVRVDGIDPGSCTVSFPDLDAAAVS